MKSAVGFFLEVVLGRTTSNLSLSFVLSYLSPLPLTAAWLIVCVFSAVEKVCLLCVFPAILACSKWRYNPVWVMYEMDGDKVVL